MGQNHKSQFVTKGLYNQMGRKGNFNNDCLCSGVHRSVTAQLHSDFTVDFRVISYSDNWYNKTHETHITWIIYRKTKKALKTKLNLSHWSFEGSPWTFLANKLWFHSLLNVFLFFSFICSYVKQWEENKNVLHGIHKPCADSQIRSSSKLMNYVWS